MSYPSTATIKKLFLLSGNTCAFPNCPMSLIDEESSTVIAEMCHIKAKNAGGKRYDASQTNQERDAFENLILMCPIHHTVIDSDEESYTVERLQQIKKNHELKASTSTRQESLERLVEDYFRSIIEKDNLPSDSSKIIKEENSSLMKAQKLASQKRHNARRNEWLYSYEGLVDGINSVNEIYALIERNISTNADTFATLGIELNNKNKLLRVIQTHHFGCQIELQGFEQSNSYDNKLANIYLHIVLYKKRPAGQAGLFYTDALEVFYLKPDIEIDGQVVWRDKENTSIILSAEGVCEKFFDLLIEQLKKGKPLDETVAGGRYSVNGELVNAWGVPIEDDEDASEDDYMSGGW